MTVYPAGAGPQAGAFAGEIYVPGSSPLAPQAATTGTATARPFILSDQASVDAQGRTVATFTCPPTIAWLVRRIVVQSSAVGSALVYVGTIAPENVVSGTISGEFDENDANQPYLIPEGQTMSVVWANGGNASARIEYTEV